jgi:hypothetical protein
LGNSPSVLLYVTKVITANNYGVLHFASGDNQSLNNASTDGYITSEWALLVYIATLNSGLWGLESQTHVLVVSESLALAFVQYLLLANEHCVLLLVSLLMLLDRNILVMIFGWMYMIRTTIN